MSTHTAADSSPFAVQPWPLLGLDQASAGSRLQQAIASAQAADRCALGTYLPVGYPNRLIGMDALHLLAQSADVIELGVPYADGLLDGPVVQQASRTALDAGFRIEDLFAVARELSTSSSAALVAMSYWQPVHAYGPLRFAAAAAAAGVDAVLIPDLPMEEATASWTAAARATGLGTIPLVSHRTRPDRLARTVAAATGMVYAAATDGVTGNPQPVSPRLPGLVARIRDLSSVPVAAGIGISTPAQARTAAAWVDVVVVGSAVIRRMEASPRAQTAAAADAGRDFAAALRPRTRATTREATA
ncbi:tryptophan synthase subunit alpha [Streptomyces sp. NPDC005732]|uniref:tryptophan synthase subunit alpha n=1 Tax=Streptomyces sp. NPDC005732 TaxID=3157057 RepID=UPI0033FA94D6